MEKNRIIKFRGLSFDKGWIYGNLIKSEQSAWIRESDYYNFKVKYETIGQYTGLKDKNGKEIYEGDIVKAFINGIWYIGQVIYEHSGFTIDVTNNKQLEFGRRGIIEIFTEVVRQYIRKQQFIKGLAYY